MEFQDWLTVAELRLIAIVSTNMAVVFASFYFVATVSVSAKTTTIGTEVFDASATDPDSSQVFYNKTCSPDPCPFEINGGTRTFKKKFDCTQSNLFDKLFKTHSGQKLLTSWSSQRIRLYTRLFLRWESKSD